MDITLADVKKKFREILNGTMSREEVDSWAYSIIQKHEVGEVIFFPPTDKMRIWSGIKYLHGIDIQVAPNVYLHNEEDIKEAYLNKFGEAP